MATYGTTTKRALRYLLGENKVKDVDAGFQALAEDLDTALGYELEIPPLLTAVEMVPLIPIGVQVGDLRFGHTSGDVSDLEQAAVLCRLDRRIAGATRIRWKHKQGATAIAGNFALTLYNAAGVKIVGTGSVAFSGAANSLVVRSDAIADTTFEAGMYYVHFGIDTTAGDASTMGAIIENDGSSLLRGVSPSVPNVALRINSGGVVSPANLLSMTDVGASTVSTISGVPVVALSVG